MKLQSLFCESFDLGFRFARENFDIDTFKSKLEAFSENDEQKTEIEEKEQPLKISSVVYGLLLESQVYPSEEHSHMELDFRDEEEISIRISYHTIDYETEGNPNISEPDNKEPKVKNDSSPYMEDAVKWLSQFLRVEDIEANIRAIFLFRSQRETKFPLPFPLLVDKEIPGAVVSGISINLVTNDKSRKLEFNKLKKGFVVFSNENRNINLKSLDFRTEVAELSTEIDKFLKKAEETQ